MQQAPEEIERVMVGLEAYLSIRRHTSDSGLSFFDDNDEPGKDTVEKVFVVCAVPFLSASCLLYFIFYDILNSKFLFLFVLCASS